MSANCLSLEVFTGQLRLWSTFWPSPHLHRRWFMSSIYEWDLKRSMCVNKTRTAKAFMPSVTQLWFWNVHHHHLYLRQRWVNVFSLQSTPVILRLLGAKILERELSGSPVISRRLANSGSQTHTRRRLQLSNSMLSDNRGTYVSRISTHIDIAPATNHNKQH